MVLLPTFMKRQRSLPHPLAQEAAVGRGGVPKAVRLLGEEQLANARRRAAHVLHNARRCACCKSLLEHMFDRIGSTLFLDDDPESLVKAFSSAERDSFSARVLAACIVLSGRERVAPVL